MRLTQIKLVGFKSFVDPTSIAVPGQLVGIVGPNGCGKSNVIDAVRWVLGESRASALRGDSMQEAGIQDGDYVLVRPQSTADNGDLVIAGLSDSEVPPNCRAISGSPEKRTTSSEPKPKTTPSTKARRTNEASRPKKSASPPQIPATTRSERER